MLTPFQKSNMKIAKAGWGNQKTYTAQKANKPGIVECFESVMGADYKIKRSGRAWMSLCPFHGERNPSFAMYEDTNSYYCFTCGEKGDSFDFLQKQLGISFTDARDYALDNGLFKT